MDVQGGFLKKTVIAALCIVCFLHNGCQLVFCTNIVSASLIGKNDLVNLVLTLNTNGVES